MSHGFGISSILRSSMQSRLQYHSFTQWLLRVCMQALLCLSSSPEPWKKIPQPLYSYILHDSKTRVIWMTLKSSAACLRWSLSPFNYHIYSNFHSLYFGNLNIIEYNSLYLEENSLGYFHPWVESLTEWHLALRASFILFSWGSDLLLDSISFSLVLNKSFRFPDASFLFKLYICICVYNTCFLFSCRPACVW